MLVSILALGGCVPYPTYRRTRPEVRLTILDARQRPIEGARVTLVSTSHPYGTLRSIDTTQTGPDGTAGFEGERKLGVEVTFMDHKEILFWNWCVEKQGFVTHFTSGPRTKVFEDESTIALRAGPSRPCPAPFR
jgi:hypothetical protein